MSVPAWFCVRSFWAPDNNASYIVWSFCFNAIHAHIIVVDDAAGFVLVDGSARQSWREYGHRPRRGCKGAGRRRRLYISPVGRSLPGKYRYSLGGFTGKRHLGSRRFLGAMFKLVDAVANEVLLVGVEFETDGQRQRPEGLTAWRHEVNLQIDTDHRSLQWSDAMTQLEENEINSKKLKERAHDRETWRHWERTCLQTEKKTMNERMNEQQDIWPCWPTRYADHRAFRSRSVYVMVHFVHDLSDARLFWPLTCWPKKGSN